MKSCNQILFLLVESEEKQDLSPESESKPEEKTEKPKSAEPAEGRPTPKIPESKGKINIWL